MFIYIYMYWWVELSHLPFVMMDSAGLSRFMGRMDGPPSQGFMTHLMPRGVVSIVSISQASVGITCKLGDRNLVEDGDISWGHGACCEAKCAQSFKYRS